MNILVTGGAGFIGSHIVDAYIRQNHHVVIIDDLSSGEAKNINPKATFFQMDLQDPRLEDLLRKEHIEVINHHAAQISVHRSVTDPLFDAKANIIGTLHLLQNAVRSGVGRFIFASTGGALYGDQERFPADEDHPCHPRSPYAIAKFSVEHYLRFFADNHPLKTIILRYSNVFGPRQKSQGEAGVVAIFCDQVIHGRPLTIFGDGRQTRDFIFVGDVAAASLLALHPGAEGIYNIGTGAETSVGQLAESLIRICGKKIGLEHSPAREYEPRRSSIDYRRFEEKFGWHPTLSLEEGLRETYNYFCGQAV